MEEDIEKLNIFLLANIPEIITQEEFVEVKQAIENLINKNKELEEKVKIIDHMCLVNKEEYQLIKNNDYIPKSKVREKIEEANKEIKQMEQDDIGVGFTLGKRWSDLKAKVKGWEELLQEGDDK